MIVLLNPSKIFIHPALIELLLASIAAKQLSCTFLYCRNSCFLRDIINTRTRTLSLMKEVVNGHNCLFRCIPHFCVSINQTSDLTGWESSSNGRVHGQVNLHTVVFGRCYTSEPLLEQPGFSCCTVSSRLLQQLWCCGVSSLYHHVNRTMIFKCCLKSSYSLRTQLLLSFGVSALISISVVVILACIAVFVAGRVVNSHADELMRGQVTRTLFVSSKLVADKFNAYMVDLEGTVQLMVEGVQDRIVGYPQPGWEQDAYVPFFDMLSDARSRKYPLNMPPPPLDWNISNFAQKSTAQEHIQERYINVSSGYLQRATFASASYFFQGACDPDETDPSSHLYYPGCSDANNDVTTGGTVQPTAENYYLWQKAGDLQVFMKPLYEAQMDALYVTVGFFNDGAGSLLFFPGHHIFGASQPYESQGCDWMRQTNPHTGKPFASEDSIARCHPAGTLVTQREYNPMEQEWCQLFALSDRLQWYGPFYSKSIDEPALMVGKGVFDRL